MKNTPIVGTGNVALAAFSSPVAYFTAEDMEIEFERVISNIENSTDFLRGLGRERLKGLVIVALVFAILATKHPAFREELEWRVISCPDLFGAGTLLDEIVSVRGTMQRIRKIKLKNDPVQNLSGLALTDILQNVIVGPTNYPHVVKDSFISLLKLAGFADAEERVVVSNVPLRHVL